MAQAARGPGQRARRDPSPPGSGRVSSEPKRGRREHETSPLTLLVVSLAFVGCEEKQKAMENLGHDQEIMKAASAAANQVIRNATDCAVAKPLVPEAYRADRRGQEERAGGRQPARSSTRSRPRSTASTSCVRDGGVAGALGLRRPATSAP